MCTLYHLCSNLSMQVLYLRQFYMFFLCLDMTWWLHGHYNFNTIKVSKVYTSICTLQFNVLLLTWQWHCPAIWLIPWGQILWLCVGTWMFCQANDLVWFAVTKHFEQSNWWRNPAWLRIFFNSFCIRKVQMVKIEYLDVRKSWPCQH